MISSFLNADKVAVTGKCRTAYYHHTGRHRWWSNKRPFEEMIARRPERVRLKSRLKACCQHRWVVLMFQTESLRGNEHNHAAQQPQVLTSNRDCGNG
ncbi:uL13 family ribosomal protein [Salmonella enterica subsp. enterica serovar Weltevreden]|nr:uL13 family ribosomal protein [Salmonella enterica subsp. enterica serovar Weltevreden]